MNKHMFCERCGKQFFSQKSNYKRKYCGKCQNKPLITVKVGK